MTTEHGIELSKAPGWNHYSKQATEYINELIKSIEQKNSENLQYITLMDEITGDKNCWQYSKLNLRGIKNHLLMAVNPATYETDGKYSLEPPNGDNICDRRLTTKHRNAFPIANLLIHYNDFNYKNDNSYQCLSASDDMPLSLSNLPSGPLPIWIQITRNTRHTEVLDFLFVKYLQNVSNVSLLLSHGLEVPQEVSMWCYQHEWNLVMFKNMTGSEVENVVVIVEDIRDSLEILSRAKQRLFIITK